MEDKDIIKKENIEKHREKLLGFDTDDIGDVAAGLKALHEVSEYVSLERCGECGNYHQDETNKMYCHKKCEQYNKYKMGE